MSFFPLFAITESGKRLFLGRKRSSDVASKKEVQKIILSIVAEQHTIFTEKHKMLHSKLIPSSMLLLAATKIKK